MLIKIFTIGVYGSSEASFFNALIDARIDTFCDIRLRRGMRGNKYYFANKTFLSQKLSKLNINYIHIKNLAPTPSIRLLQQRDDLHNNTLKSERVLLGNTFSSAYTCDILNNFDFNAFLSSLGHNVFNVVFFCVERNPRACHRSLVAHKVANLCGTTVADLIP